MNPSEIFQSQPVVAIAALAIGVAILVFGGEMLVRGAVRVATRLGLPRLFIGATIIGFGTSMPEMSASVTAALKGQADVAVGNCVGSNIFNMLVIVGITSLIKPIACRFRDARYDLFAASLAPILLYACLITDQTITWPIGLALVALLGVSLWMTLRSSRETQAAAEEALGHHPEASEEESEKGGLPLALGLIALGLVGLVAGSYLLVESAVGLARSAGVSELVIGLTIVAAGTSMPELMTSIVAARRNEPELALGNVLGSNVFNILGILGVTALVRPLPIQSQTLWLDAPVAIAGGLAVLVAAALFAKVPRWWGALMLLGFGAYTAALLITGGGGQ